MSYDKPNASDPQKWYDRLCIYSKHGKVRSLNLQANETQDWIAFKNNEAIYSVDGHSIMDVKQHHWAYEIWFGKNHTFDIGANKEQN